MSGLLRNVTFIIESIETSDIFQKFSIFLNLENYESIKVGDFFKSELPKGLNFPVLLEENWFKKPEFEVEIRKNAEIFAGIFEFQLEKNSKLSISGIATLYNVKNAMENIEMRCTIVVDQPERRESVATRETQTVGRVERESAVQTDPPLPPPRKVDASMMTSGRHINLEEFHPILEAIIQKRMEEHHKEMASAPEAPEAPEEPEVPDPKPSDNSVEIPQIFAENRPESVRLNTHNFYSRLGILRDLDQVIRQKEQHLESLRRQIEVEKKTLIVITKREELKKSAEAVKVENPEGIEKSPAQAEKTESSSSSTSSESSTSSDSTSSSSSSSSSSDSESSTSSDESTAREEEKQVEKKVEAIPEEKEEEESTIEDPFSAPKSPESSESPTSAYAKNYRMNLLAQYTQKYS